MKKLNIFLTSAILMTTLFIGTTEAGYIEPGSESDPLVSKTYVDNKNNEMKFRVVELNKGQTIIAEGGAEIIVRTGTVNAIGSTAGGISDITEGEDLLTGDQIKLNHLLLIPRSDGRGLQVKTDNTFIMIKGNYK